LEATKDGSVNLVVDSELLAFVHGVGLKGRDDLLLLVGGEVASRDDCDLLLLVEGSVQFAVLLCDVDDLSQTLVLGQDYHETQSGLAESSSLLESFVELSDLFRTNTTVFGELTEDL